MATPDRSALPLSDDTATPFTLTALYESPSNPNFVYAQKLPGPKSIATADRTTYLGILRKATTDLQERINSELTQRMEEDKLRSASDTGQTTSVANEAKEEANYGEETVEEET